jgi:hypothetical protein
MYIIVDTGEICFLEKKKIYLSGGIVGDYNVKQ